MKVTGVQEIQEERAGGEVITIPHTIFSTDENYLAFLREYERLTQIQDRQEREKQHEKLKQTFLELTKPHFDEIGLEPKMCFPGYTGNIILMRTASYGLFENQKPFNVATSASYRFKAQQQLDCTTQLEYAGEIEPRILDDILMATVNTPTDKIMMPIIHKTGEQGPIYLAPATVTRTLMLTLQEVILAIEPAVRDIQELYCEARRKKGIVQTALYDAYKRKINEELTRAKVIKPTTLN